MGEIPANPWHWVIDDPKLRPNEKLVALTIIRHQFAGRPTNISQGRISALSGLSQRTVKRAIHSMQAKGYAIVKKCGKIDYRTNVYHVQQKHGLLFSAANILSKSRGNAVNPHRKTGSQWATQAPIPHEKVSYRPTLSVDSSVKDKKEAAQPRRVPAAIPPKPQPTLQPQPQNPDFLDGLRKAMRIAIN